MCNECSLRWSAKRIGPASGVGSTDDLALIKQWGFDLSEITVPTEIHYGAKDVLVPASHGAWLAGHVPGAQVFLEEEAGHLADPDKTLELLRRLVASSR